MRVRGPTRSDVTMTSVDGCVRANCSISMSVDSRPLGRAERRDEGLTVGVHEHHVGRRVGRRRRWVGEPQLEVSDPAEYEVMSREARCQ